MKKVALVLTLLLTGFTVSFAQDGHKQEGNKEAPKSPLVTATGDVVDISYSAPSMKGRKIFGELVPYGQVWRTGANMSTDLTFKKDVVINGVHVPKGTYALFTIPNESEWTIIINGQPKQRGASEYEKYADKNLTQFSVPVNKLDAPVETLSIKSDNNAVSISWENTNVSFPYEAKK